jgi:hypothetical protein
MQPLPPVTTVEILSLWVPDTLENGTASSAVLDCVYNYTQQVGSHHRTEPSSIYRDGPFSQIFSL